MGCEELRVRWMYVRLREKRTELIKPVLPPESVMLNVAMQRGRWDDYGISMTINVTSGGTPGHQMASFFRDFIVVVDAGANETEYYGSGKIEGIIPYASIKSYEVVTEKISEDYEVKYILFTMKRDEQQFAFKLFEKRIYDENFNYPFDYTPKTNGRDIKFYTNVIDNCMSNAVDYGKRAMNILKIMSETKDSFSYDKFQERLLEADEEHWSYVLKFLREMKESGNERFGTIYDQFKDKQQASYDLAIENNKKIKDIALQMKKVQEEIEQLEEEIPNLGFFARNLKGEKMNRLEELDGMEPGLIRQQNELRAEIERSHGEIENIKKHTLDLLYKEIVSNEDYQPEMLEKVLEKNGKLNFEEIAFLLDLFNWLEPEHTETEAKKCLVPLIQKNVVIVEDDTCYHISSLPADKLEFIKQKRDSGIEKKFEECSESIYKAVYKEIVERRVLRKQALELLLNEEMMSNLGCLSDKFNDVIIERLVSEQVMKDMNKVYVSLK
ncbi:MAG: hypothetical protein K6G88_08630 [Lachnospiraceae bacterium]|nr:hypothetical protein [Lachnospiraceae bacterium]